MDANCYRLRIIRYQGSGYQAVRTIKAQGGQYTGPFSWENRKFSISELKRLQTIPDEYEIVGNRQVAIEQIGNSVPPQLGRVLALSILEQVMKVKLPSSISYLPHNNKLGFRQRKRELTGIYLKKAKAAIADLKEKGILYLPSFQSGNKGEMIRFLSPDFAWKKEVTAEARKIYINYDLDDARWLIKAGLNQNWDDDEKFAIEINPSYGHEEWVIGTNLVKLCAHDLDIKILTSLWKCFEENLTEITGKADLVQLSGYYQYS